MEFKALKIDTYDFNVVKKKTNLYIATIPYKELVEIAEVKEMSTNRAVNIKRIDEIKNYIVKENSFFPPIVITSDIQDYLVFSADKSEIKIDTNKLRRNKMYIIDGQHRFSAIKQIIVDEPNYSKNQAVFIIEYLDEYERRKLFLDINDNAVSVKCGTRERFKKSISNYLSLYIASNSECFKNKIDMEANQTRTSEQYPFKFLASGNRILFRKLENSFISDAEITFESIKELVTKVALELWDKLYNLIIEFEIEHPIVLSEAFVIYYFSTLAIIDDSIMQIAKNDEPQKHTDRIFNYADKILGMFKNKTDKIDLYLENNNVTTKTGKIKALNTVLGEIDE